MSGVSAGAAGNEMAEPSNEGLVAELARLNKILRVLMDRAERGASIQGSDFNIFQTTVMLEEQVRLRTAELEAALRENEKMTSALRDSEARFRGMVSQSLVGITIFESGVVTYANDTFASIFGVTQADLIGHNPVKLFHPDDQETVIHNIRRRQTGEVASVDYTVRGLRSDGSVVYVEIHGSTMEIDGQRALISMFLDVTARVTAERELALLQEQLKEMTVRDALTGLHNRRYFEERLQYHLARAASHRTAFSLVIADIDHFKAINDTFGHPTGDQVLRDVARLLSTPDFGGEVCRFGGEEFVILLPEADLQRAVACAEACRMAIFSARMQMGGKTRGITASFGVATLTSPSVSGAELVAAADSALYLAKDLGRNRVQAAGGENDMTSSR